MRIAAIAEAPERWAAAIGRLEAVAAAPDPPEPGVRWLFYQALLGAWEPEDPALGARMADYLVKAAREAKQATSWVAPAEGYERRLSAFAERMVADAEFRETFGREAAPFIAMGGRKSLAQLALKLAAPGVPDIYQGTERADLSLVDPDNRREVDFELRRRALDEPGGGFEGAKAELLHQGLLLRRSHPALFREGAYLPCPVEAPQPWRIAGFLRRHSELTLAVAIELSGRPGAGEVRMRLPSAEPLEPVWCWPDAGFTARGEILDLTPGLARGPVSLVLLRASRHP